MGKSSLTVRTAGLLKAVGVRTAIVDMNGIGTNLDVERFYTTVLDKILRDLKLKKSIKLVTWWKEKEREILSPPQRFDQFIRDELLPAV
jgi:adenylate cyclase